MSGNVLCNIPEEILLVGRTVPVRNQRVIPAATDTRPLRDALDLVGGRAADVAATALPLGREEAAASSGGPPLAGADAHERGGQRRRGRRRRKAMLERYGNLQPPYRSAAMICRLERY